MIDRCVVAARAEAADSKDNAKTTMPNLEPKTRSMEPPEKRIDQGHGPANAGERISTTAHRK